MLEISQWETRIHFPPLSDLTEHSFGIIGLNVAGISWNIEWFQLCIPGGNREKGKNILLHCKFKLQVTFNPMMQVFEVDDFNNDFDDIISNKKSKSRRKKLKKPRIVPTTNQVLSSNLNNCNNMESTAYKLWRKKLRKFRTTSWVVRVCTDFAIPYPWKKDIV